VGVNSWPIVRVGELRFRRCAAIQARLGERPVLGHCGRWQAHPK